MAPKGKFFRFEELVKCAKLCQQFLQQYPEIPRNSGQCYALWREVTKCQGVVNYLRYQIGNQFDFLEDGFLPREFVERRQEEEKAFLQSVQKSIQDSLGFIQSFTAIRKKHLKDFGENAKVAKQMRRDKFAKNYDKILQRLQEAVEGWYAFVQEETGNGKAKAHFINFVAEYVEGQIRERKVYTCTLSLINDLKDRLKFPDNAVNWKRVDAILPAIEDINGSFRHAQLTVIINDARRRLKKVNKKLRTADCPEPEPVLPGLTSLGPFGITTISPDWRVKFNFDQTASTRTYTCDLGEDGFNEKTKSTVVKGKTSPIAKISISDETTLRKLKIPSTAAHYAFVYPIDFEPIKLKVKKGRREEVFAANSLLSFGGYVYYDKSKRLVQLNALTQGGSDIYFTGPYELDEKAAGKIEELADNDRLADITMRGLYEQGARQFAWLRPGELGEQNHGSLLFVYKDKDWAPTYFDVVNVEVGQHMAQGNGTEALDEILKSYNPENQ